jgi:hypothetical protein
LDDAAALYKRSHVGHLARRTPRRAEALLRLQEPLRLLAAERQGHEFLEAGIAEAQRDLSSASRSLACATSASGATIASRSWSSGW